MTNVRVAVVTGANKGIGLAIVRALLKTFQAVVILTARDPQKGEEALQSLIQEEGGGSVKFHPLDIDSAQSIRTLGDFLLQTYGGLDVLVNNAAIAYKVRATERFSEQAEVTTRVNFFGTLKVCKELFPILRPHARVVNLSSSAGILSRINREEPESENLRRQLGDDKLTEETLISLLNQFVQLAKEGGHRHRLAGWPKTAYGVSKVAISALTRIQQRELDATRPGDQTLVNSVHPGYVNTELTSGRGTLTPDQGAIVPVWLALLPPNMEGAPRGDYVWCNKAIVDWVNGPTPSLY